MKDTSKDKPEVPRLSSEVKKMNGKSGHNLRRCIDLLCEVLDEKPKDIEPKPVVAEEKTS